MPPLAGKEDWQATAALSEALGYPMNYNHPAEIMAEIARLTPTFKGVSYERLDKNGSIQWPCNESAPDGTPIMHIDNFAGMKGHFAITEYIATEERVNRHFPLILTTGRILSQYNVGAQTRRTENIRWHEEDVLEVHPHDAEDLGIKDNDYVSIKSRTGETVLHAFISKRMQPGVVYTTFHHPLSGANVVTTDNSDWATNCPEYKVTAVKVSQVSESSVWQNSSQLFNDQQLEYFQQASGHKSEIMKEGDS